MKISIDVDEGMVGKSVEDILKGLAPEERTKIAEEIMKEWLVTTFHDSERAVKEKQVIDQLRKDDQWNNLKGKTDDQIRSDYDMRRKMEGWKSSREIMIATITQQMATAYKDYVKEIVENDPSFKTMKEEVAKIVRESFPKMVHDAMIAWFAEQMGTVMKGVHDSMVQIPQLATFQQELATRLGQVAQSPRF